MKLLLEHKIKLLTLDATFAIVCFFGKAVVVLFCFLDICTCACCPKVLLVSIWFFWCLCFLLIICICCDHACRSCLCLLSKCFVLVLDLCLALLIVFVWPWPCLFPCRLRFVISLFVRSMLDALDLLVEYFPIFLLFFRYGSIVQKWWWVMSCCLSVQCCSCYRHLILTYGLLCPNYHHLILTKIS